jgi:hypothetical protein
VFAGVGSGSPRDVAAMSFQVLGKNIGIEKNLRHPSQRTGWPRRSASFVVGNSDDFIYQRGIGRTAKQTKPLLLQDRRDVLNYAWRKATPPARGWSGLYQPFTNL